MKNNKGFSLVELIIAIAIMAILAASIGPVLIRHIYHARKADDIAAADSISKAFNCAMAEEYIYDAVMDFDAKKRGTGGSNTTTILLVSQDGDDKWTNPNSNTDVDKLKDIMDLTCPPADIKFKRSVTASDAAHSNQAYCVATFGAFNPNGWAIGLNPSGELCVFVTNGEKDTSIQGVALSPQMCRDYE